MLRRMSSNTLPRHAASFADGTTRGSRSWPLPWPRWAVWVLLKTRNQLYLRFFQFLRNFYHLTVFKQAEMILYAALDPAIASKARRGDFVRYLDHFDLLQSSIN